MQDPTVRIAIESQCPKVKTIQLVRNTIPITESKEKLRRISIKRISLVNNVLNLVLKIDTVVGFLVVGRIVVVGLVLKIYPNITSERE